MGATETKAERVMAVNQARGNGVCREERVQSSEAALCSTCLLKTLVISLKSN